MREREWKICGMKNHRETTKKHHGHLMLRINIEKNERTKIIIIHFSWKKKNINVSFHSSHVSSVVMAFCFVRDKRNGFLQTKRKTNKQNTFVILIFFFFIITPENWNYIFQMIETNEEEKPPKWFHSDFYFGHQHHIDT